MILYALVSASIDCYVGMASQAQEKVIGHSELAGFGKIILYKG